MRHNILIALLMSGTTAIMAQETLSGAVDIEGIYLPQVIRQDRINMRPPRLSLSLEPSPLSYEYRGLDVDFAPSYFALPALGRFDTRNINDKRGYLDLMAGSWLDANLSAGYRFVDSEDTKFGVRLQHNSTSLYKPELSESYKDVKRKLYDQTISFYGSHKFSDAGSLHAALDYRVAYYNYYGFDMGGQTTADPYIPSQTLNNVRFNAGWMSPQENSALTWNAALGVDFLAMRRLYAQQSAGLEPLSGERETDISLQGALAYNLGDESTLHLDLDGDYLLYLAPELAPWDVDNYGNITLTPGYRFKKEGLNLDLGANLDFTFGAGIRGDRYAVFHASPAVRLGYRTGRFGISLDATGGTQLNTLARALSLDYYAMPALAGTRPVYSPLDARLALNFGPFSGLTAGLEVAYKITNNQPFGGWYTAYLNGSERLEQAFADQLQNPAAPLYGYKVDPVSTQALDIKGFSLGVYADYQLGSLLQLTARGTYQPQKGDKGYFNGLDRPRWILNADVRVTPISCLDLGVGYEYRGVRTAYLSLRAPLAPGMQVSGSEWQYSHVGMRLPDLTNLKASVTWRALDNVALTLRADNLLGHHIDLLPDLPSQGLTLMGGVQVTF